MAYQKTNWVNGYTPLNASNMNKIEEGIYSNDTFLSSLDVRVETLEGKIGQGGINSLNVSGNGNAITNASYDTSTKILNFEKNNTFALDSDLDSINDKNLYHLGVFDSVSGNVITRQTGYDSGKKLADYSISFEDYIATGKQSNKFHITTPYSLDTSITTILNNLNWSDLVDNVNQTDVSIKVVNVNEIVIRCTQRNVANFKAWLKVQGLFIQYKLASSYTEEIIENQPLNTLDQSGSQWLRSEWEKGLNLINNNKLYVGYINESGDLVNTSSSDTLNTDYILLKAGTYTVSSTLPRCQISIYNLNKVFQRNISWITFTFTLDNESYVRIGINDQSQTFSGNNYLATTFKVMLVEGSHAYPYHVYQGGIAREDQLIQRKIFSARDSTMNDVKIFVSTNYYRIISIMYFADSERYSKGRSVIYNADSDSYFYINSDRTFSDVQLNSNATQNRYDYIYIDYHKY